MHWLVIFTFMFASDPSGVRVTTYTCQNWKCVEHMEQLAERDPAVVGYEVLQPDDERVVLSGHSFEPPLVNWWKS